MANVFVSGGTGRLGRSLILELLRRGHLVKCLYRPQSWDRVPVGVLPVPGDALDGPSFVDRLEPGDTLVHLTGVGRPRPWMRRAFETVDAGSFGASLSVAQAGHAGHFVYLSVSYPAPFLGPYGEVRRRCEGRLALSGLRASILRPWLISDRPTSWVWQRLGILDRRQLAAALVWAVENPPSSTQTLDVQRIQELGSANRVPSRPEDRNWALCGPAEAGKGVASRRVARRFRSEDQQRRP